MTAPVPSASDPAVTRRPEREPSRAAHPAPVLTPARARAVALGGVLCGVAGDLFFDAGPGGIGLTLFLLTAAMGLRHTVPLAPQQRVLVLLSALFALQITLWEEPLVIVADAFAACATLALAAALVPGTGLNLFALRFRDLVRVGADAAIDAATGTIRFVAYDAAALTGSRAHGTGRARTLAITRATALAAVLLLLFGSLLAEGDPVFRRAVQPMTDWNLGDLFEHVAIVGFLSWPIMGLLWAAGRRSTLAARGDTPRAGIFTTVAADLAGRVTLNRLDVLVVLGATNALFAAFMALQLRVLFGGQAYVSATTGLTLAEYARSGFFVLAFTAALVVGLLLALDATLAPAFGDTTGTRGLAGWRTARRLSLSLLALVGVVLLSATTRMLLYVNTFGFSVDRVVALAIIAWLGSTAVLFAATVLRARGRWFVPGTLATGTITLLALNTANIDAIVARSALEPRAVIAPDVRYLVEELSGDAVPTLVAALVTTDVARSSAGQASVQSTPVHPALTPLAACQMASGLLDRWGPDAPAPRSMWTVSRWRARRSVSRHEPALRAIATMDVPPVASVGGRMGGATPVTPAATCARPR